MEEYCKTLNSSFSFLVAKFNKLQLQTHNKDTVLEGHNIVENGSRVLHTIKLHIQSLETLLSDCQDFVEEVEEDLSQKQPDDGFVFHSTNGMLSYKGRDFITKEKIIKPEKPVQPEEKKKEVKRILIPEVGYYFKTEKITCLKDINPMFCYYENPEDLNNPPGLYCCIIPGIYLRVPFPMIIDSTKDYSRIKSIRCKYGTRDLCDRQRNQMAQHFRSSIRTCNFAHTGEELVKIGYPSRCPAIPRFGDPETITADIKAVGINEIKNILLYGLNDMISAALWFDLNKYSDHVFPELEKA